jgi:hypothetical protein
MATSISYLLTTQIKDVLSAPKADNLRKLAKLFYQSQIADFDYYGEFQTFADDLESIEFAIFEAGYEHQTTNEEGWGYADETHYIFVYKPIRDLYTITIEKL